MRYLMVLIYLHISFCPMTVQEKLIAAIRNMSLLDKIDRTLSMRARVINYTTHYGKQECKNTNVICIDW